MMSGKCRYSHPGTWGQECGKTGLWAQSRPSNETPGTDYWCVRCDACRGFDGPDNLGLKRTGWVPYDPEQHRNHYLQNRWPLEPVPFSVAA